MINIGIQGINGSYHDLAARRYFEEPIKLKNCESFRELAKRVANKEVDFGVMAIENSIAGSILPNIVLLLDFQLQIVGEIYMPIHHCLIAHKGMAISELTEVRSHPMAILQCHRFFEKHSHIKLSESRDTASSVKNIKNNQLKAVGAIASEKAAEEFGLGILEREIQTIKQNVTRFIVLKKHSGNSLKGFNKASLKFTLSHKQGSLAEGLNVIARFGIDMTKIESVPIIDKPWEYSFFVDVIFDKYTNYDQMLRELRVMATEFKIMGEYKNGKLEKNWKKNKKINT